MVMRIKNMKICTKLLIYSVIMLLLHSASASAQNVWVREHEPARSLITEDRLEREEKVVLFACAPTHSSRHT